MIYPYPFKMYRYYHHYYEQKDKTLKMMSCSSMFINKDVFLKNGVLFDERLSRLEDYDMGKNHSKKGK